MGRARPELRCPSELAASDLWKRSSPGSHAPEVDGVDFDEPMEVGLEEEEEEPAVKDDDGSKRAAEAELKAQGRHPVPV